LLTTDEEGRITFASGSTVALLGLTAEEIEQRHVDDELLGEGGFAGIHAGLLESYQHRLEISRKHPTGENLQLAVTASRLGGPVRGFLLLVEDLTDIKRLEEEIRFKDRMAALGEMAAGLAHEIRNPLASMTGSLEVLDKDLALEGDNARLVGIVRKESKRLDGIIRDFLQYARPRRLEIGVFNLGELARETVDLFRHSVDTVVELDIRMEAEGEVECHGDQDQIRQIVWNLVRNSVEAMPDGGVLEVNVRAAGDMARLSVRDTGVGMTAEEQRAAVQPFHCRSHRGAGLGLAIVYRIVRDHGGRINIRSRKGEGTEVAIHLPTKATSLAERGGEPEEAQL
jgi:two-component system sensor histidine kinase PilS (NtrC family)